jgi:hypothetical protein
MKKIILLSMVASVALAIACSGGAGYTAPAGSIIQNTTLNKEVSTATPVGAKSGEACVSGILGIISTGDASIKAAAAAAAGGITKVNAVDYKNDNLLGSVLSKTCTIARGD